MAKKKSEPVADTEVVEDLGPELTYFVCDTCANRFYDLKNYFYDTKSTRCLWCSKFPKAKNESKQSTA